MIWLVITSMLIIAAYAAAVCIIVKGVPYSISETFYKLEHPYWFMATMWLTAGFLMPVILEASRANTEWLAFLACAGMLLVGASPNFKDEFEGKIHTAGAILCIVGSQAWVAMNCPWCLFVWPAYIIYIIVMMAQKVTDSVVSDFLRAKPLFWAEISALLAVYLTLIIKM